MSYKQFNPRGGKGVTCLIGGIPISKSELRMEVIGDIDELCSLLGVIGTCQEIQKQLMLLSSHLADPNSELNHGTFENYIKTIETDCHERWDKMPELKSFLIPGGKAGGLWHVARAVCRRGERHMVALANSAKLDELAILYLNRLSDWLFVQARLHNYQAGTPEEKIDISKL